MNLKLQLSDDIEARLKRHAVATGRTPEEVVASLLAQELQGADTQETLPLEAWLQEVERIGSMKPYGSLKADFSRDAIYEGRGE